MEFVVKQKIKFKHCDLAGIVFYPRYVEMINDTVEDWFEYIGMPYTLLHDKTVNGGIPTVNLNCDFKKPSYLGEVLEKKLHVKKIGNSSCTMEIVFCEHLAPKDIKVEIEMTVVYIDLAKKQKAPWPAKLKENIAKYLI